MLRSGILHHAAGGHRLAAAALCLLDGVLHRHCRGGSPAAGSRLQHGGDDLPAHEGPGRIVDGHQRPVGSGYAVPGALGPGRTAPHQLHRLFAPGCGPLCVLTRRASHQNQLVHLRALVESPDAPLQHGLAAQIKAQFIKSHPGGGACRHQNSRHTIVQFLTPAPFSSCPVPHCPELIMTH